MGGVDKTGIRRMKSTHVLTGFNSERFPPVVAIFFLSIKRRLNITMSKQDLQIYLKWKTDLIIYF